MKARTARILLVVGLLSCGAACTQPMVREPDSKPASLPSEPSDDRSILAGEWEYEDGAVVTLTLDEKGRGTYAWKDGRFDTIALTGRTWRGLWSQRENDREGEFSVEFSSDFSEGEGRWWYTRIGQNHSPADKGGTFHLTRKDGSTQPQDLPPSP